LLQAKAAVAAELSEFIVVRTDLAPYPDAPPGHPDNIIAPGPLPRNELRVVITIKNIGRTRSRTSELCVEWRIIERESRDKNPDPPAEPIYENRIGMSHIFESDQILPLKWSGETNSVIRLTDSERTAINVNEAWLWVYETIRYSDFMRDEFDLGFVAHWEATAGATIGTTVIPVARGFVQEGLSCTSVISGTRRAAQSGSPEAVGLEGFAEVYIATEDGERIVAWWAPPRSGGGVVLFLHGTPWTLADTVWRPPDLRKSGLGVLAIDYRGYGGSTGSPSEIGLRADARAAFDFIRAAAPESRIAVFGESFGTGIAIAHARERQVAGVLLNAPYASALRLFELRCPPLPYR
jgi:fermentation-respiration switch protein FrsA (DUF1100 family)